MRYAIFDPDSTTFQSSDNDPSQTAFRDRGPANSTVDHWMPANQRHNQLTAHSSGCFFWCRSTQSRSARRSNYVRRGPTGRTHSRDSTSNTWVLGAKQLPGWARPSVLPGGTQSGNLRESVRTNRQRLGSIRPTPHDTTSQWQHAGKHSDVRSELCQPKSHWPNVRSEQRRSTKFWSTKFGPIQFSAAQPAASQCGSTTIGRDASHRHDGITGSPQLSTGGRESISNVPVTKWQCRGKRLCSQHV